MAQDDEPSRFADFDARLKGARADGKAEETRPDAPPAGRMRFGDGLQVGIEVVAGVAVGCLIGYGLDRWFGTSPLLLVVFFFMGAAAGMLNAYRHLKRYMLPDKN